MFADFMGEGSALIRLRRDKRGEGEVEWKIRTGIEELRD